MLGENSGNVIAGSDGERLREMLQERRGDSMPRLLNPHLHRISSQNIREGTLQSFGTFHMLDLCLHSCF